MMRTAVVMALAAIISTAAADREMEVAGGGHKKRRSCDNYSGEVCLRQDTKIYSFNNECEAKRYKWSQSAPYSCRKVPCPGNGFEALFAEEFEDNLSEDMDMVEEDALAAKPGGMKGGPMAPMAPRAAGKGKAPMAPRMARAPRAPKAAAPFPKLDKAMCTKLLDMSGKPACDMKSDKVVCAKNGVTYPNRCNLMIYMCHQMMAGKTPIEFEKDGWCAKGKDSYCAAPYMKCKQTDKVDLVCVQMAAKATKDTLRYAKNACQAKIWTACTVPNLMTVKLDMCKKLGVPLPVAPPKAPMARPPMARAPKGPRVMAPMGPRGGKAPMKAPKARNDPKMDCLRMKCDPKAVKEEWCGSDGKTYTNRCQIMFDNCMKRIKTPMGKPTKCNINGKCTGAKKPDYVKPLFKGACPKTCKTEADCGKNEACVGSCVPKKVDKCALVKCKSGTKCKEVCAGKRSVTGRCTTKAVCVSATAKAQCDLNALQNCVSDANAANPNMSPCAKLVAQSKCAEDCECVNAAQTICNRGVLVKEDGKMARILPTKCDAPSCKSAKVVDPKCKRADYKACRAKVKDATDKCSGMEAAAKCVEANKCEEDVSVMCYIARNMLGCKGGSWKDLKAVCAKSKSPVKEMSEADEELFGDYEFMRDGEDASAPQQEGSAAVVAVVACAALLAVGLAAFLLRRRAAAPEEEADYQEL